MVEKFAKQTKRCCFSVVVQRCEADSAQVKELPEKSETCSRDMQHHRLNRESGAAPPAEDGDPGFSCMGRYWNNTEQQHVYSRWILLRLLLRDAPTLFLLQAWQNQRRSRTEVCQGSFNRKSNVQLYITFWLKKKKEKRGTQGLYRQVLLGDFNSSLKSSRKRPAPQSPSVVWFVQIPLSAGAEQC